MFAHLLKTTTLTDQLRSYSEKLQQMQLQSRKISNNKATIDMRN